ncbi:ABC-type nitrate/sulfonate/bicarbonate transport system substrate-binding protein [Gillisia sp. Hel_I_86]|uniref:substrate-binding domain-containing protein n=1 Tax=Gillisia sp. Hel_I_86 TaxID=1249981 RepID=UPI00119B2180|nr:substrate-binding domain-containing protein [Gillisia sp. Hel_I_86]TVZ28263.1 ABC-type nitrate/sulfonate/bicarbonate transport system substrate-binding protein [Gillisia sp. Hel_I_86]
MRTLRVGGVPEHFNLPWHLAIEDGDFEYDHLHIEWHSYPGGTGAMNAALRSNEIDVAIILSEGIIKDIIAGNPSKIVQTYVHSPLIWGIHVDANSPYHSVEDLRNTKAAISRMGSGSHLMAYINAEKHHWDTKSLDFEIVGDIDGAVKALSDDTAQYFMWERFTTKPLVDKGIFRRVGECPTPWPCFVIAVREEVLEYQRDSVREMLKVINTKTISFKEIPEIESLLAKRYDQKLEDIKEWLEITSWSESQLTLEEIENIQTHLLSLNLISEKHPVSNLIYNL